VNSVINLSFALKKDFLDLLSDDADIYARHLSFGLRPSPKFKYEV
jgi:hypothetical protein